MIFVVELPNLNKVRTTAKIYFPYCHPIFFFDKGEDKLFINPFRECYPVLQLLRRWGSTEVFLPSSTDSSSESNKGSLWRFYKKQDDYLSSDL